MFKQQDQLLDVIGCQLPVHVVKRMSHRVPDSGQRKVFLKLVNISSDLLDFSMLLLGEIPEKQVDFDAIVGKMGCHFFTDEGVRELCDLQTTIDPVMIGKGDVGHPFFL